MVIKMWARIQGGKVAELIDIDPDGRFHPSLKWVSCDDAVKAGMMYSGGSFYECTDTVPELTREQVESLRLRAYADPITGSDRFFAEAARMEAMGEDQSAVAACRDAGAARYQEIQNEYPWP